MQVASEASRLLLLLNADAASANNLTELFASKEAFPAVFQRREELEDALQALQGLLVDLAKQACVPKLTYTSIQNQVLCIHPVQSCRDGICWCHN